MTLPQTILPDAAIWGFRPEFNDAAFLEQLESPRLAERFGDAAKPLAQGTPLADLVRNFCRQEDVAQPFIWAKLSGETSFLTAKVPPGKGYVAPLGFDCPDGGRDPRPVYYGVWRNLAGGIAWWGTFRSKWDVARRMADGMVVNTAPAGQPVVMEAVLPRTAAEVAYLVYTPHLYSLHDFLALYAQHFGAVDWSAAAVERMRAVGLSDGTRLDDPLTRREALVMLDRLWAKVGGGKG